MCVKYHLAALFVLIVLPKATVSDLACHRKHEDYFKYLATKTGYRFIQDENDRPLTYPGKHNVKGINVAKVKFFFFFR
jgi:hypothetical protein